MEKTTIALTVDVEDWPQSTWDHTLPLSDYCADNTKRMLEIIAESGGAKATFFVLGKFAEKHPHVVRTIHEAGYEVASHGWGHVELFHLGKDEFTKDIKRSTAIIADITGVRPVGYRAPDFSIVRETLWALDVLAEQGYAYDSSIFPISKARYGIHSWPRIPNFVKLDSGLKIVEFPLATLELFGKPWPVGGGGYARLLPGNMLSLALRKAQSQLGLPPVFYCHPYELDPNEFDRMTFKVPLKARLHQGLGRKSTAHKLRQLLKHFNCISLKDLTTRCNDLPTVEYSAYILESGSVVRPPAF
jgi:polysaccharide deacetylase family protein (PEP-CTERM system associated)